MGMPVRELIDAARRRVVTVADFDAFVARVRARDAEFARVKPIRRGHLRQLLDQHFSTL